jgi:hypothetical protein
MDALSRHAPHLFGSGREPQRAATAPSPPRSQSQRQVTAKRRVPMRPTVLVDGEPVTFLPIGDLAAAIGRSVSHIRLLEAQGILPPAHRRRRVAGHLGWRMYRAEYVAELAQIAAEEKITARRAVMDMTRFSQRAWSAHRAAGATARGGVPRPAT